MSRSKLEEILEPAYFIVMDNGLRFNEAAKIDIKLLMLNIYKEALEEGSVAEMSDRYQKIVEGL